MSPLHYLKLVLIFALGCKPPLSSVTSSGIRATVRLMVLQEGSWVHYVRARPSRSVLLLLTTDIRHRKKREAKIKREVKRGIREPNEQNPFEIFITVTDIRYT